MTALRLPCRLARSRVPPSCVGALNAGNGSPTWTAIGLPPLRVLGRPRATVEEYTRPLRPPRAADSLPNLRCNPRPASAHPKVTGSCRAPSPPAPPAPPPVEGRGVGG